MYPIAHVIAKAQGLAIISVIKAGFLITARGGSGIVIARLADRRKDWFVCLSHKQTQLELLGVSPTKNLHSQI